MKKPGSQTRPSVGPEGHAKRETGQVWEWRVPVEPLASFTKDHLRSPPVHPAVAGHGPVVPCSVTTEQVSEHLCGKVHSCFNSDKQVL